MKNKIILIIIWLISPVLSFAQSGSINKHYGNNGVVRIDLNGNESIQDVISLPDDQYLITGVYNNLGKTSSFISKINENGSRVNTFGLAGVTTLSNSTWDIAATDVIQQSDGSFIIGGRSNLNDNSGIFLSRIDKNGNIDPSFGTGGYTLFSMDTNVIVNIHMAELANDGVLLAGTAYGIKSLDLMFIKFDKDGILDLSYGSNGVLLYDVINSTDYFEHIIPADNGSFFGVSYLQVDNGEFSAITKFTSEGIIDTDWANNGRTFINNRYVYAGAIDSEKRMILAGRGDYSDYNQLYCLRLDSTGEVEESFGNQGVARVRFPFEDPICSDLKIQDDGKILITGEIRTYHSDDIFITRLEGSGKIDSSFSYDGQLTANPTYTGEQVNSAFFSKEGDLLVFGNESGPGNNDVFILSYTLNYGLGIENNTYSALSIFPNPSTGLINLNIDETIESVKLIDMQGRLHHLDNSKEQDLRSYSRGNYIIEIITGTSVIRSRILLN